MHLHCDYNCINNVMRLTILNIKDSEYRNMKGCKRKYINKKVKCH